MKKYVCLAVLSVFMLLPAAILAQAKIPPVPSASFYVQDYAKVLSAGTRDAVHKAGEAVRQKTKAQVVVVTVKTLDGVPIEEYALALLRKWGIGDKDLNNGVLLLVAVEDRASRIEVGYGLEGALPDGKTGRIQDEFILPYFKDGDYNGGILNGYMALSEEVLKEYEAASADVQSPAAKLTEQSQESFFDTVLSALGAVVVAVLVILDFVFFGGRFTFLFLSLISRRGGGGGGYGGGSGGGGGSGRRW